MGERGTADESHLVERLNTTKRARHLDRESRRVRSTHCHEDAPRLAEVASHTGACRRKDGIERNVFAALVEPGVRLQECAVRLRNKHVEDSIRPSPPGPAVI